MIESKERLRSSDPRALAIGIVCLIVGVLVGWLALPVRPGREVPAQVVRGVATAVDQSGTRIGISPDGTDAGAVGYGIAGARFWKAGVWSSETCLEPLTAGQSLEIGVVNVVDQGPVVVWVKCLS